MATVNLRRIRNVTSFVWIDSDRIGIFEGTELFHGRLGQADREDIHVLALSLE